MVSLSDLDIRETQDGSRVVVHLSGELDYRSADDLRRVLARHRDAGTPVDVDLTGLTFIDSGGLGVLVGAWKRGRLAGVSVRILAPAGCRVRPIFDLTGLERLLSEEEVPA